jgi:succinoglycan biosynthesis protein ExoV
MAGRGGSIPIGRRHLTMRLYHWQGHARNFGDELNTLLWPALLPDFFDDDAREIFLGIGSVLDSRHPAAARKIVAGAGYGGYETPPVMDANWTIHWVRGPRTAGRLGLPTACGMGDPASLIDHDLLARLLGRDTAEAPNRDVGFMPHFETACRGAWPRAAARAGLVFIDPRDEPGAVLAAIARCRLLVSEALHGVVVADALRVPWVAVAPFTPAHTAEWDDWAGAMSIDMDFARLAPSSLAEQFRLTRLAAKPRTRAVLDRHERLLRAIAAERFADRAAKALSRAACAVPRLSDDRTLARSRACMRVALDGMRRAPRPLAVPFGDGA